MNPRSFAAGCLVVAVACSSGTSGAGDVDAWRDDPREPYPFTTPIPGRSPSEIDGVYLREVSVEDVGEPVPCRRCAPYRIYAGRATLAFIEGRYHVADEASSFASSGHYTIDGNEITLFNDLVCPALRVTYRWSIDDGLLVLDIPADPCAFDDLRGRYLTTYEWAEKL